MRCMVTSVQLLSFLLAAIVITASPGPDNLMVLSMGMSKGRLQGIAFGLGCAFGCVSHTALAVMGVSAVVAASPPAFAALKWTGGAYLIWLGVNALRSMGGGNVVASQTLAEASLSRVTYPIGYANAT